MADINTVPLGQAGTGAAFLLGGSRALQNWMGQNQRNRQINQYNQQQQGIYDQNLAKSYAANRIKEGTGLTWQNEIHNDVAKLSDVASKYLAQGFDVYKPNPRDPNQVKASQQFLQDRAMIDQKINAQKAFEESRDAQSKLYQADPYQYESESYDNLTNFPSQYSAQDVITKGIKFPSVQKTFDYDKNVRDQIPALSTQVEKIVGNQRVSEKTANLPAIEKYAKNLLSQGQQRNWVEKQIGGSLDGLIGTDDKDEIRRSLDNEFRSPNGVQLIAELTSKGKVPSFDSPQYKKFLDDAVEEQYKAETKYDKILSNAVQDGISKVNPEYKKVNDFSLNAERRAARSTQLREQSNAREATRFNERNKSKADEAVLYRQNQIDDIWGQENSASGASHTIDRLKSVVEANPEFKDANPNTMFRDSGRWINISIPAVNKTTNINGTETVKKTEPYTVRIDKRNPQDKIKLNKVLDYLTGEKISERQVQTGNPGGKIKGEIFTEKSIPKSTGKKEIKGWN